MKHTKGGKIVAYTAGQTFTAAESKLVASRLKTYIFTGPTGDEAEVRAVDAESALRALGVGSSYQAEWGDHRGLIAAYQCGELDCQERVREHIPVALPRLT